MKFTRYLVAIAALACVPLSSNAMSLQFDFTGPDMIMVSKSFTESGVTLGVTAERADTKAQIDVSQNMAGGIGGCTTLNDCGANLNTDSPELDSDNPEEILNFSISGLNGGALRLDSIQFADLDIGSELFILVADGVEIGTFNPAANPFVAFGTTVLATTSFSIQATTGSAFNSSFRIASIDATKLSEPGTLGMLTAGLLAFAFARRRIRI